MVPPSELDTRAHVRRAVAGDDASLGWLLERWTPLLLAMARQRIGQVLRRVVDPQDLVQEVWAIALPKLGALRERIDQGADDNGGGLLMAFLARTLTYRCNDLVRKHLVGKPRTAGSSVGMLQRLPGAHSGAVTRAVRRETQDAVRAAIEQLEPLDRDVVLMRGLERHPVPQIAAALGVSDNVVSQRYRRALDKLRGLLPAELTALFAPQ
ncbi:MAG: sigma-70 family RNA polymerase sigma factor [Planctomycetota bacterium]